MSWDQQRFDELRARVRGLDGPVPPIDRERLYERVVADARHRRRRRARLIPTVAVVILLIGGAAWAALREQANPNTVYCWAGTHPDADAFGARPDGADALDICADIWEAGELTNPAVEPGEVPPLFACLGSDDTLWVFPELAGETCDDLGLAEVVTTRIDPRLIELRTRAEALLDSSTCLTPEDAALEMKEIITDLDLAWEVSIEPPYPGRPCAGIAFDTAQRTVLVVPDIPRPRKT